MDRRLFLRNIGIASSALWLPQVFWAFDVEPNKKGEAVKNIWTSYKVTWLFLTKLCASVPANPEIVEIWTKARRPKVRPPGGRSIAEINEEVVSTLIEGEEEPEYSMLVFQRKDGQLVVRAGTVKAHMKDCARVLSTQYIGRVEGEKAFSTKIINGVYPDPIEYWLPIKRVDGSPLLQADGTHDKPVHAKGPRGIQINALKTFEYVEGARLDFTLMVLGKSVKEDDLHYLFSYGGVHGYAGERSDGEGKYSYTLELIEA